MNIDIVEKNGNNVAVVYSDQILIADVQSALDFLMTVKYETGCANIAVNKDAILEDFFILRTRLAGEVLQKVINL